MGAKRRRSPSEQSLLVSRSDEASLRAVSQVHPREEWTSALWQSLGSLAVGSLWITPVDSIVDKRRQLGQFTHSCRRLSEPDEPLEPNPGGGIWIQVPTCFRPPQDLGMRGSRPSSGLSLEMDGEIGSGIAWAVSGPREHDTEIRRPGSFHVKLPPSLARGGSARTTCRHDGPASRETSVRVRPRVGGSRQRLG